MGDTLSFMPATSGGAIISNCGQYRYTLARHWSDVARPRIACFVMLNPSTADAMKDDPTIKKCIGFAQRWGLDGISVVNLFAFRATLPADMRRAVDPIGPDNDRYIVEEVNSAERVICAWGPNGTHQGRDKQVLSMVRSRCLPICLKLTKDGHPWHPLMASYGWPIVDFKSGVANG